MTQINRAVTIWWFTTLVGAIITSDISLAGMSSLVTTFMEVDEKDYQMKVLNYKGRMLLVSALFIVLLILVNLRLGWLRR